MTATSTFLFVNKTPGSGQLTQSRGSERSRIFSHVQRAGSSSQEAWNVFPSEDWTPDEPPTRRCRSKPKAESRKTRTEPPKTHAKSRLTQPAPAPVLSPQRLLGASGDPFDTHKAAFTPRVEYFFQIYNRDIAPLLYPIESVAKPSRDYTLSLALEDPLMHHSLLSAVLTRMYSCTGQSSYHVLAMSSKHRALAALRSLISKANGERVHMSHCYAISLLIWIECLIGNPGDLTAHASGLQFLLPRADDIRTIPVYILRLVYACSYLCTAFLNVPPPAQPVEGVDESHLSLKAKTVIETLRKSGFDGVGHSFYLPQNLKILGSALTRIVIDYQEIILLRKMVAGDANEEYNEADVQYVCLKEAAIERDLLSLSFECSLNSAQEAIRLAMFIYSTLPLIAATGPSAALSRTLAKQIRQTLEGSELSTDWERSPDLLLWVLVIGAFICRGEVEWPWFRARIFLSIDQSSLGSALDMESRLFGYYPSKYLHETVASIWHEYEGRT